MPLPSNAFDTFVWLILAAVAVLALVAWKLVTPARPPRAAGEPVAFGATSHTLQDVPSLAASASGRPAGSPAEHEQLLEELAQHALRLQRLESLVEKLSEQAPRTPQWKRSAAQASTGAAASTERLAESLYAEAPDGSGEFAYGALTLKPVATSLFEIKPGRDKRSAAVTLYDNPDMHRQALQNQKRFLQPVCDYADVPRYSHTTIVVTKPGRAERQETGWRMTRRIGINFS